MKFNTKGNSENFSHKKNFFKLFPLFFLFLIIIPVASSETLPHLLNSDWSLVYSSNNATACNLTYIQLPNSTISNLYIGMISQGQDYSITMDKGNFSSLGTYCAGISCTNGSNFETKEECRIVTPSGNSGNSNITFIIILFLVTYAVAFIGFFGRSEVVTLLGGMFMLAFSVYMINEGIFIYRDWITNALAYITMGLGAYFSIVAGFALVDK